jgi:two-component system response regulator PrrA
MTTAVSFPKAGKPSRVSCLLTGHSRKRVLLVEDDLNLVRAVSRCLRKQAFDVLFEFRGDTGLDTALILEPDVVLLDLGLPGMRGTKVLEELQRHMPELPIVVITGDPLWESSAAVWGNVVASFKKPFPTEQLIRLLDDVLGPPHD